MSADVCVCVCVCVCVVPCLISASLCVSVTEGSVSESFYLSLSASFSLQPYFDLFSSVFTLFASMGEKIMSVHVCAPPL